MPPLPEIGGGAKRKKMKNDSLFITIVMVHNSFDMFFTSKSIHNINSDFENFSPSHNTSLRIMETVKIYVPDSTGW